MRLISRKTSYSGFAGSKYVMDARSKWTFRLTTPPRPGTPGRLAKWLSSIDIQAVGKRPTEGLKARQRLSKRDAPYFTPHSYPCNTVVTILTKNGLQENSRR